MTAISASNVGKLYRLGAIGGRTLQDDVARMWARIRGKSNPLATVGSESADGDDEFWALRDVSFSVERGDVLGIVGRNGAGKSTLLKILSQVTMPTTGRIDIKGRIASLLEVGTGFHPELTGRENVFLNGTILGMTTAEIRRKFDDIVAFSGVEAFIDTPVKRYSSGMNVRLAFAVAAHLDPEILVVDEVLAVGDAAFQQKCVAKMRDVASGGRTILFVSHDLGNVSRLCNKGLLLNRGQVEATGPISEVIARYTAFDSGGGDGYSDLHRRAERSGTGDAEFQSIELRAGQARNAVFEYGETISVGLTVQVRRPLGSAQAAISILTPDGIAVHEAYSHDSSCLWEGETGMHTFVVAFPHPRLYPGEYVMDLWLGDGRGNRVDYVRRAITFQIVQTPKSGVGRTLNRAWGLVFQPSVWTHATAENSTPRPADRPADAPVLN